MHYAETMSQDPNTSATDRYWTVDTAMAFTGRHRNVIDGWVKAGKVETKKHPTDGRIRLLRAMDVVEAHTTSKRRGHAMTTSLLTTSDGETIAVTAYRPVTRR
jgi:hypothetical protein